MSNLDREALAQLDAPWVSPSRVIVTGLAVTALGWLGCTMIRSNPTIGIVFVVLGMLGIGVGLALHLSTPRSDDENPYLTSLWWLLGAVGAFIGSLALEQSADSMSALLNLATLAAVFAAILSAVPLSYRLVGISLLIGWHFFAIYTATQIIPPPTGNPSWFISQIWTRFTRPYLQITHLNNAYHFYAPEPGPVALVWLRVRFADGAVVWERLPNHPKINNHIERRRRAAIASALGQAVQAQPGEELIRLRDEAAQRYDPVLPPRPQGVPIELQYRDPGPLGKMLIESLVRYFARTTPHPTGENVPVVAVRVYRGECNNPPVEHFQAGRDPLDPTLYRAWYLGEYDPQGKLVESSHRDMLYWLIPIIRVRDNGTEPEAPTSKGRHRVQQEPWESGGKIINFLRIHAGDGNKEDMP